MKEPALSNLLVQAKITNRLLAVQLRNSLGQKELVGILMSVGATQGDIADVLDTSTATVKATVGRLRREKAKKSGTNRQSRRGGKKHG